MLAVEDEKNDVLSELSAAEYAALRRHLAPVELRVGHYVHCFGDAVSGVIFPCSGLVAISMPLQDHPGAAAALIGRDGIVGASAALADAPASSDAVVHIEGYALRLPAAAFRELVARKPSLFRLVTRYAQALVAQSEQNAVCNAAHTVDARICRLLLAIQARCGGGKVPLTQGMLAQLLGVRRTTVTMIAGQLEALGVISCHRGYTQIIDQHQLEHHSCECHAMLKDYLSKLLSPSAEAAPLAPV